MEGKFIVFLGVNSTGKSTQKKILVDYLQNSGLNTIGIKYPIYDSPTGEEINEILRGGRKQEISEFELQSLYVKNRREYEPVLVEMLSDGTYVVSEDYRGTSLSWSLAKGMDMESNEYKLLEKMNSEHYPEDIAFLFDGKPFVNALEKNHIHESNNDLMKRSREMHNKLGEKYGWIKVDANQPKEVVHESIVSELRNKLII